MTTLEDALNCIEIMKKMGIYRGHKIGKINKKVPTITSDISGFYDYSPGEIILFREELFPSDGQVQMGEYRGVKQKPSGYLAIEKPMSTEDLKKRDKKDYITTFCTTVCVPKEYVEEIPINLA
jgi:hypothetical protein